MSTPFNSAVSKTGSFSAQLLNGIGAAIFAITIVLLPRSLPMNSAGGFEENLSERSKWLRMMYADPKTGRIPMNARFAELGYVKDFLGGAISQSLEKKNWNTPQSETWTHRGPWNVGGRTRALAYDLTNPSTVIAAGVSGGIWKSDNDGITWRKTQTSDQLPSITSIAQDPRAGKGNNWYASTGEVWGNSSRLLGYGFFRSSDNGESWTQLRGTTLNSPISWDDALDYSWRIICGNTALNTTLPGDVLFAATPYGGILRSQDGGNGWTPLFGVISNSNSLFAEIELSKSGTLYTTLSQRSSQNVVSTQRGIYRSVDGKNWANIKPSWMPTLYNRIVIGIAPSDENQIYFFANTPGTGKRFVDFRGNEDWNSLWKYTYKSGDGTGAGGEWTDLTQSLPDYGGQFGGVNSQGSYNMFIKVSPTNPEVLFLGATNVYRSTTGGTVKGNWKWIGGYEPNSSLPFYGVYPNHYPDNHELIFHPRNPTEILCANDGGVFRCRNFLADSVVWDDLNRGYLTSQFYTVALDRHRVNDIIIGGLQDNGTLFTNSTNSKATWTQPGLGDGSYCGIAKNGLCYLSRQQGRVGKFELNADGTVKQLTRIDPLGGEGSLFIAPFALDPNNANRMYLTIGEYLWRNDDLGGIAWGNWDTTATTTHGWTRMDASRLSGSLISSVACCKSDSTRLYFGGSDGQVFRVNKATSTNPNDPATYLPINQGLPEGYVNCIAVDPENADDVFVVFTNYNIQSIYHSTDGGERWTAVGGNLELSASAPSIHWLTITKVGTARRYFVGTSVGLLSTSYLNASQTAWSFEGTESTIGNMPVMMMDYREQDGMLVVSTHGNGVQSTRVTALNSKPKVPVQLIYPENNRRGVRDTVALRWTDIPDAGLFKVEVSETPSFDSLYFLTTTTNNYFTLINLPQGKRQFYWRVIAINAGGELQSNETWSFKTSLAPPKLISPANSSPEVSFPAEFKWSDESAVRYHLQFSRSITFSTIVKDTTIVTPFCTIDALKPSSRHYWRVSAEDNDGVSGYSARFSFTTIVSSVDNASYDEILFLAPIPATDLLYIRLLTSVDDELDVDIFDSQGRRVLSAKRNTPNDNGVLQFDIRSLPIGWYSAKVSCASETLSQKLFWKVK